MTNEVGATNTLITIDGGGGGRGLNIACSGTTNSVSVTGLTFLRNCGSSSIGALRIAASSGGATTVNGCRFLSSATTLGMGLEIAAGLSTTISNCLVLGKTNGSVNDGDGINISGVTGNTLICNSTVAGNYQGYGADITASAVLTVTNNVFASNWSSGLYFYPGGTKTAVVVLSNDVFIANGVNGYGYGANINNFGSLNLGANVFNANKGGGAYSSYGNTVAMAGNTFYSNGVYGNNYGGAAILSQNMATVTGNTFSGNSGFYGGGGANFNGNITNIVTGNTFSGNSMSAGEGGAAYFVNGPANGITTVSNNTFSANTMNGPGGAVAINGSGTSILTGNTFTGNSCSGNYGGGAAYFTGGTNIITFNTFQQNSSADGGGAIYVITVPVITISDNLVVNNTQSGSGATGGGIFVNATSTLYMVNNTVFGNSSGGGGGGTSFQVNGSVEVLNVFNNIIWGNSLTGGGSGSDVYLTGSGLSKLFMYNDANGLSGVWNSATPQLNADPKFFNPVNGDFHLQPGSPCANYGTNGTFLTLTDLDGNLRTNSLGQVDLGCYEFNTAVTHPADTNGTFVITPAEYNAYAAAWKAGQTWTSGPNPGPNPIPANYVTRAGYLMTNGGTYTNAGSARPVNWKSVATGQ